jgi:hypothetical protein
MEAHREDSPEYPENPRFSSTQRIGAHDKDCCMRMSNVSDGRLINDPPLAQSPRGGPLGDISLHPSLRIVGLAYNSRIDDTAVLQKVFVSAVPGEKRISC